MRKVDLFNADLGIQNILNAQDNQRLPSTKQLTTSTLYDTHLDTLYSPTNMRDRLEHAVCPDIGDGEVARVDVFSESLKACALLLKDSREPEIHDFLRRDLFPLLENEELLRTYYNLMLGG